MQNREKTGFHSRINYHLTTMPTVYSQFLLRKQFEKLKNLRILKENVEIFFLLWQVYRNITHKYKQLVAPDFLQNAGNEFFVSKWRI